MRVKVEMKEPAGVKSAWRCLTSADPVFAPGWSLRRAGRAFDSTNGSGFHWSHNSMADFPDIVEASLRARFVSLGVQPDDVEETFIRGTGAGGQKVNKTSSTVRLRHRPTGLDVRCQRERNQSINRLLAWTELADRLQSRQLASAGAALAARELERRRRRQKSRRQKGRMIADKHHRAGIKRLRGRSVNE
jgi:protein subunit release factor B